MAVPKFRRTANLSCTRTDHFIVFSYLSDTSKRRRRFNPLRNLRKIFRRRTVGHADGVRHAINQQIDTGTTTSSGSIRPLGSQSVDDVPSSIGTSTLKHSSASGGATAAAHNYNIVGARYSQTMLPIGSSKYRRHQHDPQQHHHVDLDMDDEDDAIDGGDFQRSSSEGRLVDK